MPPRSGISAGVTPSRQRRTPPSAAHTRSSFYLLISLLVLLSVCSPAASTSHGVEGHRKVASAVAAVLGLPDSVVPPSDHNHVVPRGPVVQHAARRLKADTLDKRQDDEGEDEDEEEEGETEVEENEGEQTNGPPDTTIAPNSRSTTAAPLPTRPTTEDSPQTTTPATTARTPSRTSTASSEPEPTDTGFPLPFDTSLSGRNMTSSGCLAFFQSYIHDQAFQDCFPISAVMVTSSGFFEIMSSFVRLTRALDSACAVPREECTTLLTNFSEELASDDNCGADLRNRQSLVVEAYNGLISYPHVRDVTCLKNPVTDSYCFADAMTNTSNPSDSNLYFLPLGISYPGGTRPTCTQCLQASMEIFSKAAAEETEQPLSRLYNAAADQINIGCGPSFVATVNPTSGAWSLFSPTRGFGYDLAFVLSIPFLIGTI